jgi:hypothetical protein
VARHFDVTVASSEVVLGEARAARAMFVVTNPGGTEIGGDAIVSPATGASEAWFSVDRPARPYPPLHSESIEVAIDVPPDAAPGRYGFVLRVLLAGGVPEEDYDDSPVVSFEVAQPPAPPPEPPAPPARTFPWLVVVVAVAIGVIVIGGAAFLLSRRGPAPDLIIESITLQPDGVTVGVNVRNGGDADAGAFDVDFTVDDDNNFTLTGNITELGAGKSTGLFFGVGQPQSPGRSFIAVADRDNVVPESNDNNNDLAVTP